MKQQLIDLLFQTLEKSVEVGASIGNTRVTRGLVTLINQNFPGKEHKDRMQLILKDTLKVSPDSESTELAGVVYDPKVHVVKGKKSSPSTLKESPVVEDEGDLLSFIQERTTEEIITKMGGLPAVHEFAKNQGWVLDGDDPETQIQQLKAQVTSL